MYSEFSFSHTLFLKKFNTLTKKYFSLRVSLIPQISNDTIAYIQRPYKFGEEQNQYLSWKMDKDTHYDKKQSMITQS